MGRKRYAVFLKKSLEHLTIMIQGGLFKHQQGQGQIFFQHPLPLVGNVLERERLSPSRNTFCSIIQKRVENGLNMQRKLLSFGGPAIHIRIAWWLRHRYNSLTRFEQHLWAAQP